jgi:hypothetical protein
MKKRDRVLMGLWAAASCVAASSAAPVPLRIHETIAIQDIASGGHFMFGGTALCDSGDNVYLRQPPASNGAAAQSVWRIQADGKQTRTIDLMTVSGHERDAIKSMALGSDDHLFLVTTSRGKEHILEFDASTKLASKTEIDPDTMTLKALAVFNSGAMLVATRDDEGKPTTGIYNPGRNGIAPLSNVKKDPLQDGSAAADDPSGHYAGEATPAADGNVYLVRQLKGPVVGVSATGQVVRRFPLTPPKGADSIEGIKASGSRLAIAYSGPNRADAESPRHWFSVYDLSNGKRLAEYALPQPGGALLCYNWSSVSGDTFTVLGISESEQVQFVRLAR